MELVLYPMISSVQNEINQQQLQKQFGHLGNSVYNMQMPKPSAPQLVDAPVEHSLSTSMAELLELSGPSGGLSVTPNPSGSWDPSASLHLHESQHLHQLQPQLQTQAFQQSQGQSQGFQQTQQAPTYQSTHAQSDRFTQMQPQGQHAIQSPFHASSQLPSQLQHQSQGATYPHLAPSQVIGEQRHQVGHVANSSQDSLSQLHQLEVAQVSGAEPVSVSIIQPAIWSAQDRQQAQHTAASAHLPPAHFDSAFLVSSPAASSDAQSSVYGSAAHQPPQQLSQQLLPDSVSHLSSRPPLAGGDSKRSIATNTQLTMHRGDAELHRPGAMTSHPYPGASAPPGSSWTQSQDAFKYGTGPGDSVSAQSSNCAPMHSQTLPGSHSAGSLNLAEGLEGRISGQIPMQAGSPALGGQPFPKASNWSPRSHDPFDDLVQPDLKRIGSNQSNASMS